MFRKNIGEKYGYLLNAYEENYYEQFDIFSYDEYGRKKSKKEKEKKLYSQENLNKSVVDLFSEMVLFNTTDVSGLYFSWMPLEQMHDIRDILETVEQNVREKYEVLPEERQEICEKRLNYMNKVIELALKEK